MDGLLAIFATSLKQQLLPHRSDCSFQSLYFSYILGNVESWQALPNNDSVCSFIQDEPLKPEEIVSIEKNEIHESLTPLESSFSSSDVGNKERQKEEEL
jgi:hypothetical protein